MVVEEGGGGWQTERDRETEVESSNVAEETKQQWRVDDGFCANTESTDQERTVRLMLRISTVPSLSKMIEVAEEFFSWTFIGDSFAHRGSHVRF